LTSAAIQAATHAAILSFGSCLHALKIDMARSWSASTPVFRVLMALVCRIVFKNPEVYWEIQAANPFAADARSQLAAGMTDIEYAVQQGDFGRFCELFQNLQGTLGPIAGELQAACSRWRMQTNFSLREMSAADPIHL